MRRFPVVLLVIFAALAVVACGGSGSSTSAKQKQLDEMAESYPEVMEAAAGSTALLDLSEGRLAGARAELAKACPDTPPDEAMEHLREIQQAHGSREEIETELAEDLC